jgi:CDP-diacylglycerol--glycerol-3-phosphate 3-phosphatidyltransferase
MDSVSLPLASAHLSDEEFLSAFHSCQLKTSEFRHADHLRLAWLHLKRQPFDQALSSIREGIQRFADHHGATGLYHETITQAWLRLLATHHEATFTEFLAANSDVLNKTLLERYWSRDLLESREAREQWVEPDRQPLPVNTSPHFANR